MAVAQATPYGETTSTNSGVGEIMGLRQCGRGAALVALLLVLGAAVLFVTPTVMTLSTITNGSRRVIIVAALVVSAAMVVAASCRNADSSG